MISIKVDMSGMEALKARLNGMSKQVNYAASRAINSVAFKVMREESAGTSAFDRPKPATRSAFRVEKSTKHNLLATIAVKSRGQGGLPANEYLHPNIKGGRRGFKRSEIMLRAAGILPAGMFTAPGKGAKLDAYGNMSRGQIAQILSYFQTYGKTALNSPRMNMTQVRRAKMQSKNAYFVIPNRGIWQRNGKTITPILMFISKADYKLIFDFEKIAQHVIEREWEKEFNSALADAIRTAR
jgi:hypothetical protein